MSLTQIVAYYTHTTHLLFPFNFVEIISGRAKLLILFCWLHGIQFYGCAIFLVVIDLASPFLIGCCSIFTPNLLCKQHWSGCLLYSIVLIQKFVCNDHSEKWNSRLKGMCILLFLQVLSNWFPQKVYQFTLTSCAGTCFLNGPRIIRSDLWG